MASDLHILVGDTGIEPVTSSVSKKKHRVQSMYDLRKCLIFDQVSVQLRAVDAQFRAVVCCC